MHNVSNESIVVHVNWKDCVWSAAWKRFNDYYFPIVLHEALYCVFYLATPHCYNLKCSKNTEFPDSYPVLIIYRIYFVRLEVLLGVHHIIEFALILY